MLGCATNVICGAIGHPLDDWQSSLAVASLALLIVLACRTLIHRSCPPETRGLFLLIGATLGTALSQHLWDSLNPPPPPPRCRALTRKTEAPVSIAHTEWILLRRLQAASREAVARVTLEVYGGHRLYDMSTTCRRTSHSRASQQPSPRCASQSPSSTRTGPAASCLPPFRERCH